MHVPDGFIDAPVSVATGVVAAGAVAAGLRGARRELDERTAPLAGLVAAFIFAVQMLNFPVAAGTSGHLLGGALAAILVGPWTGILCVSVVLLMQGVLFADGGLTALGVNITDMGVVTVVVAYAVFRGLLKVLPRGRRSLTAASFTAALISVPAAALAFTGIYALGGTADVALGKVATAMIGVHVLIGIGEAVITAATVGAVAAVRPDLVHGARGRIATPLEIRTVPVAVPGRAAAEPAGLARAEPAGRTPAEPAGRAAAEPASTGEAPSPEPPAGRPAAGPVPEPVPAGAGSPSRPARSTRRVWAVGLLTAVVLAGGVSYYASSSPDGLEKVAADHGFDKSEKDHAAEDSPLAGYQTRDVGNAWMSSGLAGVIGVGATLVVGSGVFVAVRRRRGASGAAAAAPRETAAAGARAER